MDLFRGNSKQPQNDWGSIARRGFNTSGPQSSRVTIGARGHPLSPPQIRRHLLPNYQLRPLPKKDAYKTLFSIPEGQAPPSEALGALIENISSRGGLSRSSTLPPSAIRRSPIKEDVNTTMDDSGVKTPLVRSFRSRFGSFRKQPKQKPRVTIHGPLSSNTDIYVSKKLCSLKPQDTPNHYEKVYAGAQAKNTELFIEEDDDVRQEDESSKNQSEAGYSAPEPVSRDSPDASDRDSLLTGKRSSYSSSASEFSRSNLTTSTDEGISSYDDTCSSSIWSSSEVPSEWRNNDDIGSIYGGASLSSASTCSSGSSLFRPTGPIPKRWSSLRRPDSKRSNPSGYYSDSTQEMPSEMALRRGGSLRVPRQLPVTTTLLKLLQLGLEQVGTCGASVSGDSGIGNGVVQRREKLHPPRTDANRLSRANLEESGDLELDAILNELCALEGQLDLEISTKNAPSTNSTPSSTSTGTVPQKMQSVPVVPHKPSHIQTGSGSLKKFDNAPVESESTNVSIGRTDSPDNDSAFSDNVSMLSSESSASSGASGGGAVNSRHDSRQKVIEQNAAVKAEKIKMALEKLKEANVRKLFIKAFSVDGSSKSLLVDEKMTVSYVTRLLSDKNHVRLDPKWAVVEHLPDLYMERIYEDNEMLVDNLLLWTRDSKNTLRFLERHDKYDFFVRPENYMSVSQIKGRDLEDDARNNLIEECFTNCRLPEVEGPLFLKSEGKKAWKKFYFVLRQSGLYYCPKGKNSKSSKDLICLAKLDSNHVYHGFNWRKKYKAPTEHCFALKHPHLQTKNSKLIKYLCAEDSKTLSQWIMGIRIAKCGQKLVDNYRLLVEDIAQEDIDMLASSRSFSLASVSGGSRSASQATTPSSESRSLDSCLAPSVIDDDASSTASSQDTPVNTLSRAPAWRKDICSSSSSSSGCLSERSSTATPTGDHGFESDFPQGTIKRKPASNPKIPLTSTTRHLVKEVEDSDSRSSTLKRPRKSLSEEVNTLRRRNSNNVSKTSLVSSVPSLTTDDLPLPPPPEVHDDTENLPPPPPELLASTLSLNSLPPPPEEAFLSSLPSEMTASIISLPPPPPPPNTFPVPLSPPKSTCNTTFGNPPATPPKPKVFPSSPPPQIAPKPRRDSIDSIYARRPSGPLPSPPQPIIPPTNNIYENRYPSPTLPPQSTYSESIYSSRQISNGPSSPVAPPPNPIYEERPLQPCIVNPSVNGSIYSKGPKSPSKKKKISFSDEQPPPVISPMSPSKPLPPRRSEATRLSNPGRLESPGCKVTPPRAFLTNLQKVMQKKWQVAQKCRDFDKMPHEVLGFRDPIPQSEAEKNVGAWIEEHYGSLYENMSPNGLPPASASADSAVQQENTSLSRKKPPPPLPRRSENTQLSVKP